MRHLEIWRVRHAFVWRPKTLGLAPFDPSIIFCFIQIQVTGENFSEIHNRAGRWSEVITSGSPETLHNETEDKGKV